MAHIHPTALVEDGAILAEDVRVGPFTVIGAGVRVGAGSTIHSHVALAGDTEIGPGARIFPFASVGHAPQDLKYGGEASRLVIGRNVVIRESVTVNPGTAGGGLVTRIGNDCVLLIGAHVAHDCQIGDNVLIVNNVLVGGHCEIGAHAILAGGSAIHQFVRIGAHAFIGGLSGVENDVIPYGSVLGNRARLGGLNLVGLKRRGFSREDIHALRRAYRMLFAEEGTLTERTEAVAAAFPSVVPVQDIVAFLRADSSRAVCAPRNGRDI